jgi:glycerophosphoryl diester phosphodiesterase
MGKAQIRSGAFCLLVTTGVLALLPLPPVHSTTTPPKKTASALTSSNPFRTGRTLVIPHAGGDGLFPENTLYAYEKSLALGGDVVDVDVFMTADNALIAMHDSTLDRTTNGSGSVAKSTLKKVSKLDAGWNFKKNDKYIYRNKGIRVPTVETVLRRFPGRLTTLDLKDQRVGVVPRVCELLRKLNRTKNVYVGVDTNEQVLEFRRACPEVHTSGTDEERRAARAARESGDTSYVSTQLVGQPRYLADDGTARVTAESLAFSHRNGTAVLTWVVDDPDDMVQLIKLGVDGIYTRRPDVLVRVLKDLQR